MSITNRDPFDFMGRNPQQAQEPPAERQAAPAAAPSPATGATRVVTVSIAAPIDQDFRLCLLRVNAERKGRGEAAVSASHVMAALLSWWLDDPAVIADYDEVTARLKPMRKRSCGFHLDPGLWDRSAEACVYESARCASGGKVTRSKVMSALLALWAESGGTCVDL